MKTILAICAAAFPLISGAQSVLPAATIQGDLLIYRSSFDDYRAFNDEPVGVWRELHESVRKAGGWRAYAREASQSAPVSAAPTPLQNMPQTGMQK